MVEYSGKSACGGIAVGEILVHRQGPAATMRHVSDPEGEVRRFRRALDVTEAGLEKLQRKALAEAGEDSSRIFEIHRMMLRDPDYVEAVEGRIRSQSINAEYAVDMAGKEFADIFSSMDDEYMSGRAADVADISAGLIRSLSGEAGESLDRPVIIVAEDLTPSETVRMDKSKILAFVTTRGSVTSHTAILAATMNIPAIVGANVDLGQELSGKTAVLDGDEGKLYVDPSESVIFRARSAQAKQASERQQLEALKGIPTETPDGRRILLYANIGSGADLDAALENDAEGIGLLRSEFLYLERKDYPTEDELFEAYRSVAQRMGGKRVIIRTLDIGADKQADYFGLDAEENPAMGLRAVRLCLRRPEVFKTQLRAIYRASAYGKIAIMYPMITSVDEVINVKSVARSVQDELIRGGIPCGNPEQGIMIETPAAAVISDMLAPHVDFFSIGTNDLCQYTMAIDRQNKALDEFFDPYHPAVMRMIEATVKNAHACGKWAGICGELGGDPAMTETFVRMGVDELSVAPPRILPLRKKITQTNAIAL